jgi:hypothetical protein
LENIVEGFSSFAEFLLGVKLTWHEKNSVDTTLKQAYLSSNYLLMQYVNNCITSLPQLRSYDKNSLNFYRQQFLTQLQDAYSINPMAKALFDLYSASQVPVSPIEEPKVINVPNESGMPKAESKSLIVGKWVRNSGGGLYLNGIATLAATGYRHYESYEFNSNNTFRRIWKNESVRVNQNLDTKGSYTVTGNKLTMNSSDLGEKLFEFKLTNTGRSLELNCLNDIFYSNRFEKE